MPLNTGVSWRARSLTKLLSSTRAPPALTVMLMPPEDAVPLLELVLLEVELEVELELPDCCFCKS